MGASPLGGMPSGCAASKSIGDQFVFPMISVVSGIRNALDLLDLSVLPTAIRVGRRRRIRFGFLTALLGLVASTVGKGKLRPHVAAISIVNLLFWFGDAVPGELFFRPVLRKNSV